MVFAMKKQFFWKCPCLKDYLTISSRNGQFFASTAGRLENSKNCHTAKKEFTRIVSQTKDATFWIIHTMLKGFT
jgi:hypothetical protein